MPGGLLTFLMAALFLLIITGCEKDPPITLLHSERSVASESEYNGDVITQYFMVYPDGNEVSAFGGVVWLKFPEGTVSEPTEFFIASFPTHHLDFEGYNMYGRGISLQGETPNQNLVNVIVRLKYDLVPENWCKGAPGPTDDNLTIYQVSPNTFPNQRIKSTGDCCVDCSCTTIKGCISCCGSYVIGEK